MNIIETTTPDVTETNLNEAKMSLAENIISNVYPLFDDVIDARLKNTDNLEAELKAERNKVIEKKNELENLMSKYSQKQKVSKLLHRLEKLIRSGLIYDGALKNETTILLKVIDTLDEKRLDMQLEHSMQILSKRFAN